MVRFVGVLDLTFPLLFYMFFFLRSADHLSSCSKHVHFFGSLFCNRFMTLCVDVLGSTFYDMFGVMTLLDESVPFLLSTC